MSRSRGVVLPVIPGTGIHPRSASATSLKALCPEIDDSWSSLWYPTRKGEDLEELHVRTASFANVFVLKPSAVCTHSVYCGFHTRLPSLRLSDNLGEQDLSLDWDVALFQITEKPGATVLGAGWRKLWPLRII